MCWVEHLVPLDLMAPAKELSEAPGWRMDLKQVKKASMESEAKSMYPVMVLSVVRACWLA